MSVYSNIDILNAIKTGDLIIKPFSKELLKPSAVFMRLDNKFAIPTEGVVDPVEDVDLSDKYETIEIGKDEKFELKPGEFILARTYEKVAISPKLAMFVEGRSTLARLGLSVTQTAMVIEAGHGFPSRYKARPRKIVLEIANVGPFTVYLTPKMKIAKGVVIEMKTPTDMPYDSFGRYGHESVIEDLVPIPDGRKRK